MSRRQVVALSSAALAVGAFSAAGGTIPARAQSPVPDPVDGDFAGLVDIGGPVALLTCAGSGGPTVVLVTGYRDTSDIWSIDQLNLTDPRTMVMPSIAEFTRVCAYDRPGTATSLGDEDLIGRSDAIPQPRTATRRRMSCMPSCMRLGSKRRSCWRPIRWVARSRGSMPAPILRM